MSRNTPPTLLIYFNRPEILERTLRALAEIRPNQLFLASDGPRSDKPTDPALIQRCHEIVRQEVTWNCEVRTLRADRNHGCDVWVPTAIDWFFAHVEQGIILEDDCVISDEFYRFAEEMLEIYAKFDQIMCISAANFHNRSWGDGDYYMSRYPLCWGWASWRRAWSTFDPTMRELEDFIASRLDMMVSTREERLFWRRFFRGLKAGRYTFWDAKWVYSIWRAGGMSISPNYNLVSNIGYGSEATHTHSVDEAMNLPIAKLTFPIRAPSTVTIPAHADATLFRARFRPTFAGRFAALSARISSWVAKVARAVLPA